MQGIEKAGLELLVVLIAPPLVGWVIGLLVGLRRNRPWRGGVGGLVGGTIGAWVGVLIYRLVILPGGADLGYFTGLISLGFFLTALPVAWYVARPSTKV